MSSVERSIHRRTIETVNCLPDANASGAQSMGEAESMIDGQILSRLIKAVSDDPGSEQGNDLGCLLLGHTECIGEDDDSHTRDGSPEATGLE